METMVENIWSKSKLLVKALIIGTLVLLLQIPTFYIKELIREREQRQREAITEVSSRWAGRQNIAGPVLVLPYWQYETDTASSGKRSKQFGTFLPDDLKIQSQVRPEERYRGIYKVMLYTSKIDIRGSYQSIPLSKLNINPENVIWEEAFAHISLSDLKGLNNEPKLNWNGQAHSMTTDPVDNWPSNDMIHVKIPINASTASQRIEFATQLDIAGSEQLLFTPVGKTTTVSMQGKWPHPSFTGSMLPSHEVRKDSFHAEWKAVAQKRSFPQQWKNNAFIVAPFDARTTAAAPNNITMEAFGTDLFVPVNGYQKTMRTIKYAALCILLTFAAFFLVETTNRRSVHPLQYGLVGLALVLFYTLLLSFSEYIGFNPAYAIASVATIGLIAWFVKGIMGSARLTVILSVVLFLMYTYVFTILQLQDYSLLLGSLGLFITLAVIMHYSKKIQW